MSLVEHVVKDSGKQALQLFEGCFGEVPVEEVTFLFDILLPKILGGVQVKEILTKGIAKTTEIFEIYFYSLIRRIRVSADETGSLLSTLVEITLLYAGVHISRGNAFLNKSNLRMLIFFLTAFLLERKK